MSTVTRQIATMREKNGAGVSTITTDGKDKVQVALLTQNDTVVIAAYWFTAMRSFFIDAQCVPLYWSVASRHGEKWSHSGEPDSITKGAGMIGLDEYLALPPFNWMAPDRSGASAYALDDKFMCRPLVKGLDAAAAIRAKVDDDIKSYSVGTLWTLYSGKQSSRDGAQSFELYARHMVNRWEALIGQVQKIRAYVLPSKDGGIFKMSIDPQAHAFWQVCADIEADIQRQQDILKSMPSWDTWVSDSAHRVKDLAEDTIQTSADAAGQTAAWAANQAGKAAGAAGAGFMQGIGIWGLMFVAAMIALR